MKMVGTWKVSPVMLVKSSVSRVSTIVVGVYVVPKNGSPLRL